MRFHKTRLKDINRHLTSGRLHLVNKGGPVPNPEHFKLLSAGKEVWNQWREKNPGIQPDLSGIMFVGEIPPGAAIEGTILSIPSLNEVNLTNTNLHKASFWEVELFQANLKGANLANTHFYSVKLNGADLTGANLTKARFDEVDLTGAILVGADLREVNWDEIDLRGVDIDLRGANLSQALLEIKL